MSEPTETADSLDSSRPTFLDDLDRDPQAAMRGFHRFAYGVACKRPPAIMKSLTLEEREDIFSTVILRCCDDNFRRLRSYTPMGKPFSGWLTVLMYRATLDYLDRRKREPVPTDDVPDIAYEPPDPDLLVAKAIRKCMAKLSEKCRLYLTCFADGMKPREIVVLLQLGKEDNKAVADTVRGCLKRLGVLLRAEGIEPEGVTV